jgi:glycogen debranching enzyme
LWSGIAEADKAHATMQHLMSGPMFSGWGVRTLASVERRYNPLGYHVGTVWPHDNALIAAGLRRA